jgi:DNA-binding transcriptional ArsR family regulator
MDLELQRFKAEFFKALAHPLRIRILELLAEGDKNVNEMQAAIGAEGSAVSQQLSILRSKNIVQGRKEGTRVLYSLRDPMIVDLLRIARQIFNNHLIDTITMLDKISDKDAGKGRTAAAADKAGADGGNSRRQPPSI